MVKGTIRPTLFAEDVGASAFIFKRRLVLHADIQQQKSESTDGLLKLKDERQPVLVANDISQL